LHRVLRRAQDVVSLWFECLTTLRPLEGPNYGGAESGVGADLRVGPPDGWTHRSTPTDLCGECFFTGNSE
jgi:hypothetical protein